MKIIKLEKKLAPIFFNTKLNKYFNKQLYQAHYVNNKKNEISYSGILTYKLFNNGFFDLQFEIDEILKDVRKLY